MAITGAIAVAAIGTAYSATQQRKAQKSQEESLAKQETTQARLAQETKDKEAQAMATAFQQNNMKQQKSLAKGNLSTTGTQAAPAGGAQVAGTKTVIGQ